MRLFISAGEPSGDLHGANLIAALRRLDPSLAFSGFGGDRMTAAGCDLLYPMSRHAVIGFLPVVGEIAHFARLLEQATRFFRTARPDAVVMIDFPGFHWWLAKRAKEQGIPVIYFVPPQLWAWGGWRITKLRRTVSQVLCTLPFEEPFYLRRHVPVEYVGHPYFDELHAQRLDETFLAEQRSHAGTVIGVLPGSRRQELHNNVPSLLRAAERIHSRRPDTRFLVACLKPEQARRVREQARGIGVPLEVHDGRTPEIIELAHSCLAVSGSVSLELLFRARPTVVMYRVNRGGMVLSWLFQKVPYISLPNLLVGRELFPEFLTSGCPAEGMADRIVQWLNDSSLYDGLCEELAALRDRIAIPGACARAAQSVLNAITARTALAA
jgi:lipid-A-disaccharide synthase